MTKSILSASNLHMQNHIIDKQKKKKKKIKNIQRKMRRSELRNNCFVVNRCSSCINPNKLC